MTKKSFVIILILSIIVAIVGPVIAFGLGLGNISDGFPLEWSHFSFMGSNTNYNALLIDILFWFIIIWIIWKILSKLFKKK